MSDDLRFLTLSRHPVHPSIQTSPTAPQAQTQATTLAVKGMTRCNLPTHCERDYRCEYTHGCGRPRRHRYQSLPDRQEASSIPGSSVPEFKGGHRTNSQALSLIISSRGAAAVSAAGSLWSYYGVQVSEHWEYTEMQWVYVASLTMTTYGTIEGRFPFFWEWRVKM